MLNVEMIKLSGVTRGSNGGTCPQRHALGGGILFHTMTRIARNHARCRGKVGRNKKCRRNVTFPASLNKSTVSSPPGAP